MSETLPDPEMVDTVATVESVPTHCRKGRWSTLSRAVLYAPVMLLLVAGVALSYFPLLAEKAASFVLPEHDRAAGCNGTACHCSPGPATSGQTAKK